MYRFYSMSPLFCRATHYAPRSDVVTTLFLRPSFSSTTEAIVKPTKKATPELRLRVISAVDYADGSSIRERIKETSKRTFYDDATVCEHTFTWRTISTWVYRFKKNGITSIDNKTRSDKHSHRKIQVSELAEAISEILPTMSKNKVGIFPKSTVFRKLMASGLVTRKQLSQTSFYRMVRENDLLNVETTKKLRESFAMKYANGLWQADTMHVEFTSIEELNNKTQQWIEQDYNHSHYAGIQMKPVDRFNLDFSRITFLTDDEYSEDIFFYEEGRIVGKTNLISINSEKYESPPR